MAFETSGSLTTDKRQVATSETWDTQSDWEAYQSATNVDITNGIVGLADAIPGSELTQIADHIWYVDEGSGTTFEDAVGTADATTNGGVTWITGMGGAGDAYAQYDGVDDIAISDSVFDTQTSFTICVWCKPNSGMVNDYIMQQDNTGALIFCDADGYLSGAAGGTLLRAYNSTKFDTWQMVAVTYASGTANLYIYEPGFGQVYTDAVSTSDPNWGTAPLEFGGLSGGDNFYSGEADYYIVSYQDATEATITDHFNKTVSLYQ